MDDKLATLKDEQLLEMLAEEGLYRDEVIERVRLISQERGLLSKFDQKEFKVIQDDGQDVGPLDVFRIRDLFQRHLLHGTSLLFVDSLNRWIFLSDVFETSLWLTDDLTPKVVEERSGSEIAETAVTRKASVGDHGLSTDTLPDSSDSPTPTSNSRDSGLKGVGGWLLWFIIGQLVCRPLQFIGTLSGPNSVNASQIADRFPFTATLINIEKIVMIASIVFGVIVAAALLRTDDSRPVTLAKVYLVANTVFSLLLAILYSTNDLPDRARSELITQGVSNLVVTSILCGIWFLYFTKSRRVRLTYLDEGFGTSDELTSLGITQPPQAATVPAETPIAQTNIRGARVKMKLGIAIAVVIVLLGGGAALLMWGVRTNRSSANQEQTDLKAHAETMSHEVGVAADKAGSSLNNLRGLGLVSTKPEAERGIASVEEAQALQTEARNKNSELVKFVEAHRSELQDQNLGQLVDLIGAYGDTYTSYQNALSEFLTSYHEMLTYVRDHSDAIQQSLPPYRGRYEALYNKYAAALQKQNKAYLEHIAFLKRYANEHPNIASTLNEIVSKTGQ